MISNFEGNPERPVGERRIKRSPLRDVASMIRSFHYVSHAVLFDQVPGIVLSRDAFPQLERWASVVVHVGQRAVPAKVICSARARRTFLPRSQEERAVLLEAYTLEKALIEIEFELDASAGLGTDSGARHPGTATMKFPRSSGILLHPTSLPGPYGIGDFGAEAYRFADFLHAAGMRIWQVLPLNPTGYGDSPYQSFSAFAGNPLLLSLEELAKQGLLTRDDLQRCSIVQKRAMSISEHVIPRKFAALRTAASNFYNKSAASNLEFQEFQSTNSAWLDDYALFMAAKDAHDLVIWTKWDP